LERLGKIKLAVEIKLTKYKYIIPDAHIQSSQQMYSKPVQLGETTPTRPEQKTSHAKDMVKKLRSNKSRKDRELPASTEKRQSISKVTQSSKATLKEPSTINDFLLSNNSIVLDKDKLLSDFERKKQEYQLQMERFKLKK
jgi:hypothetical protein